MTATRTAPRLGVTAPVEAGSFETGSRIELPCLSVAPGPELAAAIASLVLADLSVGATIEVAAACQRLTRWVQGTQLLALAEYGKSQVWSGEPEARDDPKGVRAKQYGASDLDALSEFADREVSCALGISPMTAAAKLGMAQDLDQRLPATRHLMLVGVLDEHKARLIVRATRVLKTSNAAVVEAQILPRAAKLSYGRLKSELARLVIAVDPVSAAERHERARQRRMVSMQRGEDGMGTFSANLTADGITTVWNALDARAWASRALAGQAQGDDRTLGQRRADALVEVCAEALDRSLGGNVEYHQPPDWRHHRPTADAPEPAPRSARPTSSAPPTRQPSRPQQPTRLIPTPRPALRQPMRISPPRVPPVRPDQLRPTRRPSRRCLSKLVQVLSPTPPPRQGTIPCTPTSSRPQRHAVPPVPTAGRRSRHLRMSTASDPNQHNLRWSCRAS